MSGRHLAWASDGLPQSLSNAIPVAVLLGLFWSGPVAAQAGLHDLSDRVLAVHEGRLTANLDRVPLRGVLEGLARQVPLRLLVSEGSRDQFVTAHFRALPIEDALARLLTGHSYAFTYASAPSGEPSAAPRRIVELMVLGAVPATEDIGSPEATGLTSRSGSGTSSGQEIDATPEWLAALEDPDSAVRLRALDRVPQLHASTTGSATLDLLNRALVDPDEAVRARAQELAEQAWAARAIGQ